MLTTQSASDAIKSKPFKAKNAKKRRQKKKKCNFNFDFTMNAVCEQYGEFKDYFWRTL